MDGTFTDNPSFDLSIFNDNGIDDIDFYIETNIGEGLKPLAKIASGGEVSRIMLAFKALTIKSSKVETVIFDEIDTGISGEVASKVARKIYEISLMTQVISITHLPQVAALSKNHLKIAKEIKNKRTYTSIKYLSLDEKMNLFLRELNNTTEYFDRIAINKNIREAVLDYLTTINNYKEALKEFFFAPNKLHNERLESEMMIKFLWQLTLR